VADSLEKAGERLFTFTRLPPSQWRSVPTTNAIERLHAEFKCRINDPDGAAFAETAATLLWALLAAGQIATCAAMSLLAKGGVTPVAHWYVAAEGLS
jgi:putative transposase